MRMTVILACLDILTFQSIGIGNKAYDTIVRIHILALVLPLSSRYLSSPG